MAMTKIEIKRILAEKNVTQTRMAKELGMKVQRLSEIFSGRMKGWKYRRRISQYLGVAEEILFPDDGQHTECQNINQ
jgi:transcriptional regulator with XRE-family HTH domain